MPTHAELIDLLDTWDKENEGNMPARYLRAEFKRIQKSLEQLDKGTSREKPSPGVVAAKAASKDGHRMAVDENRPEVPEGREPKDQPKTFAESAALAHDVFMQQLAGVKRDG